MVHYLYLDDGLTSQLDQNSHPSHVPTADYLHMDGEIMMAMMDKELIVTHPLPEAWSSSQQPSSAKISNGGGLRSSKKNMWYLGLYGLGD